MTSPAFSRASILLILIAFVSVLAGFAGYSAWAAKNEPAQPLSAPAAQATDTPITTSDGVFHIETFTLANGLQVVVLPNHRAPVITHMVWYRVGAADEPRGKSGIAHFLEHLMFKGTKDMPPGDFSKRVRGMAGEDNAFTSWDYTAYYVSIAKDRLETIMGMEADRMRNLNPPADHFASEHDVIIEERRQRTDNDPRNTFWNQLQASLFINHPYGIPILGWPAEMEQLTWEDAKAMYDIWYAPNNAIVVISGDVTAKDVKPLAEKIYGPLKPATIPPRVRTVVPWMPGDARLALRHDDVREPIWVRVYRVPSLANSRDEAYAFDVLQEALAGNATTRFYKSLVVDQKLATTISFSYSGDSLDDGTVWLTAVPAPGVSIETVEKAVDALLQDVIANGFSASEVNGAIERLQDNAVYARDSVMGPAMMVGRALTTGATLDDIQNWPKKIGAVTPKQLQDLATKYLNHQGAHPKGLPVTGILLPLETAPEPSKEEDAKATGPKK